MEKNSAISAVCFYIEVVRHLGWKRETVIPVELLKQTPSLFTSPSILYNFFHSLSYFRRPNLSIFFPIFAIHHQNLSCDLTRTRCVTDKFSYTQIKKTVNTENIPGMCVLTNHMRDLVTAENEWVLSHGIELFRKTTRFNLHQFILQKLEVLFLSTWEPHALRKRK